MKRIFLWGISFSMLVALILNWACTKKNYASLGPVDEITLVADKEVWEQLKTELSVGFEKEIETPRPEKIFYLNHITMDEFPELQLRRNLVFVSTLESQGKTIEVIKKMIPETDMPRVEQGQSFFFKKEDPWAYNQMLLVLVAKNVEMLKQKMLANKDMLFDIFDKRLTQLVKKEVYGEAEQKQLSSTLMEKYGWSLRIQHDYQIFQENSEKQFIMLMRDLPKRWICIAWFDTDDPSLLTQEWCYQFRNNIYANIAGNEVIDEKHTRVDTVEFYNRYAFKLVGLYGGELEDGWPKVYGGPFRSFFVYVEQDRRIYMIDYAMFAPDREKKMYLRQLDIMANTFKTEKQGNSELVQN